MVYVRVIVPLHSVPDRLPVVELTDRLLCVVQLSDASAPLKARYPDIVVTAAGRSLLHSSSVAVGAVTCGDVSSDTLKI